MKKVSLGTWAFVVGPQAGDPTPFDECLARIKRLGFDGLELGARPPHPSPSEFDTPGKRADLRRAIGDAGLGISGLGADFLGHHPAQEDRSAYLGRFEANLRFCRDLGIGTLRVDSNAPPEGMVGDAARRAIDRAAGTWKACARRAAGENVRVVWEFEPGFAFNKPAQILEILEAVDEPNFGVLFDTCHAHMVASEGARQPGDRETLPGGELELLRRLQGHVGAVHVIDSDGSLHDGRTSTHAPIGSGRLDFDALVPALLSSGAPTDWWCIDLCFWPDAWAAAGASKAALDGHLAKYDAGS